MLTAKMSTIGAALSEIDSEAGVSVLLPLDVTHAQVRQVDLAKREKLRRVAHIGREALAHQVREKGALELSAKWCCSPHNGNNSDGSLQNHCTLFLGAKALAHGFGMLSGISAKKVSDICRMVLIGSTFR
jgi:hypothetical protein